MGVGTVNTVISLLISISLRLLGLNLATDVPTLGQAPDVGFRNADIMIMSVPLLTTNGFPLRSRKSEGVVKFPEPSFRLTSTVPLNGDPSGFVSERAY